MPTSDPFPADQNGKPPKSTLENYKQHARRRLGLAADCLARALDGLASDHGQPFQQDYVDDQINKAVNKLTEARAICIACDMQGFNVELNLPDTIDIPSGQLLPTPPSDGPYKGGA